MFFLLEAALKINVDRFRKQEEISGQEIVFGVREACFLIFFF